MSTPFQEGRPAATQAAPVPQAVAPAPAPEPAPAATRPPPAPDLAAALAEPAPGLPKGDKSKPLKLEKTPRTAILEDGVWKPFKLFAFLKKEKESELRSGFGHHSASVDEIQLDIERTEQSLAFLREQITAQEARLTGLRADLAREAEDAARYLRSMTTGAPLREGY